MVAKPMVAFEQRAVAEDLGEHAQALPFADDRLTARPRPASAPGAAASTATRRMIQRASALRAEVPGRRIASLARTIETEVVPRLVLARRAVPEAARAPEAGSGVVLWAEDVVALTEIVLGDEVGAAASYVGALCARGVALEGVYLNLLAPSARRLGEMWKADLCDFAAVTMGLWRLQQVLHEFSPTFQHDLGRRREGRRALLSPVPGEQHTFGLVMVTEFFRRAGWDVRSGPVASRDDLATMVSREWYGVVGFSVSCDDRLEALASAIRTVRRASRNPAVGVMVGGPVFVEQPELAARVGADATAMDGRQAALQAEGLMSMMASRR